MLVSVRVTCRAKLLQPFTRDLPRLCRLGAARAAGFPGATRLTTAQLFMSMREALWPLVVVRLAVSQ